MQIPVFRAIRLQIGFNCSSRGKAAKEQEGAMADPAGLEPPMDTIEADREAELPEEQESALDANPVDNPDQVDPASESEYEDAEELDHSKDLAPSQASPFEGGTPGWKTRLPSQVRLKSRSPCHQKGCRGLSHQERASPSLPSLKMASTHRPGLGGVPVADVGQHVMMIMP